MTKPTYPPKPAHNSVEEMRWFMDRVKELFEGEGADVDIVELDEGFLVKTKKNNHQKD